LYGLGNAMNATAATFFISTTGYLRVYTGNAHKLSGTSAAISLNNWNHIAFVRSSGTINAYLNGVLVDSAASWTNALSGTSYVSAELNGVANNIYVGGSCYISNLRVLNGTALYTSQFTPPSSPLLPITNTVLLLNATNAGIIDSSQENELITYGTAAISTTRSKFGGSSMYFDGSTGYVASSNSIAGDLGTGDFTIECWMNASATGTYISMIGTQAVSGSTVAGMWRVSNRINSVNGLYFDYTTGSAFVSTNFTSTNINDGNWHHIAVVRQSGTVKGYVDGVVSGTTATISQSLTSGQKLLLGYQLQDSTYYTGYLDEVRITKGYARYTANFTPPISAFLNT